MRLNAISLGVNCSRALGGTHRWLVGGVSDVHVGMWVVKDVRDVVSSSATLVCLTEIDICKY